MKSYSVEEFNKALASPDGMPTEIDLSAIGLTKVYTEDVNTVIPIPEVPFLLFSPGKLCSFWLPVPNRMIASIDYLGKIGCFGQDLDLVCIHFKTPQETQASILTYLFSNALADAELGNTKNYSPLAAQANFAPTCQERCQISWATILFAAATLGGPLGAAAVAAAAAGLVNCVQRCP